MRLSWPAGPLPRRLALETGSTGVPLWNLAFRRVSDRASVFFLVAQALDWLRSCPPLRRFFSSRPFVFLRSRARVGAPFYYPVGSFRLLAVLCLILYLSASSWKKDVFRVAMTSTSVAWLGSLGCSVDAPAPAIGFCLH